MDEVKKMLRAVINGQSALKEEMIRRFDELEAKVDKNTERIENLI